MKKAFILSTVFSILFVPAFGAPYIEDPDFIVEKFVSDVELPTSIHFINNDMLILEKNGQVRLVRNGVLEPDPVLSVNVHTQNERGLLGITSINSTVFLYFTEGESTQEKPTGNRIYQYDWNGSKLTNEVLLHDLPVSELEPIHNGGAMVKGFDDKVYAVIGDAQHFGILQNMDDGNFDDTGVILIVDKTGSNIKPSQSENPDQFYYAIGIRNSFGLAIDPKTGNLWDTENGPTDFDEINLVEPKFNSGWRKVMGPANAEQKESLLNYHGFQYSDPEFSWENPVGPTDLTFVDSDVFKKYEDYLLVGDIHHGKISKFKLNENRDGFIFNDSQLQDNVLNIDESSDEITFAEGFLGVTSIEFGPDGFLYVASFGDHSIFRIVPSEILNTKEVTIPNWLKKNVEYWVTDRIDNPTFISGMKFLIEKNILVLSDFSGKENSLYSLELFKKNAESWKNDEITDSEFGERVEFLIYNNLINLDTKKIRCNTPPTIASDLSDCNLSGRNFSKLDISHSIFTNANLSNVNFYQTDLRNADLSNSIMVNSNLEKANLHSANLTNVDLTGANLFKANLRNADASYGKLVQVNLSMATMQKINLVGANLEGSNLSNATIFNANLTDANLKGVDLSGAMLTGASLRNVNLEDAITTGCQGCP